MVHKKKATMLKKRKFQDLQYMHFITKKYAILYISLGKRFTKIP